MFASPDRYSVLPDDLAIFSGSRRASALNAARCESRDIPAIHGMDEMEEIDLMGLTSEEELVTTDEEDMVGGGGPRIIGSSASPARIIIRPDASPGIAGLAPSRPQTEV